MARPDNKILIADDDEFVLLSLKLLLEQNGFQVETTQSPERIPSLLEKDPFEMVLLDMNFRQGDTTSTQGLFWLKKIHEINPVIPVILITAYGEIPLAVEAMKQGAYDFITKPWSNEKLIATIKNARALYHEKAKTNTLTPKQKTINEIIDQKYESLIGDSEGVVNIRKMIDKVASTDTAVLILGDNGTGKEVIARSIHQKSLRGNHVFVSVDMGSLSDTIFESELFGHKKGAFTDAKEDRIGRFEAADGGTLFLDEIGNLPLSLQSKLLTVLQHKTITRLGTNNPIPVNVRIICATNSSLKKLVQEGKFREDLYYRINTVEITVPPLFERLDDLPMLAEYFLKKFKNKYGKDDRRIPDDVMATLQKYRWPGNIRELQHALERAVILSEKASLSLEDFGVIRNENSGDLIFDQLNLEKLESWAIRKAIDKHKGNVSHAAAELGLSRGAMYRRMDKYGL
jgi:two-component system response regulator HydG